MDLPDKGKTLMILFNDKDQFDKWVGCDERPLEDDEVSVVLFDSETLDNETINSKSEVRVICIAYKIDQKYPKNEIVYQIEI